MKPVKILLLVLALLLGPIFSPSVNALEATDYSRPEHWLARPATAEKAVDIFYLYPTAWLKVAVTEPNICAIDNPSMLAGAKFIYNMQATAFETVGNIYAPYYRQADAAYILSLPLPEQHLVITGAPKTDVFAAFDYYIKNLNHNRPFIIAGHSQGSYVMLYLLSEYMKDNPAVYARMVAAYLIGYSVTGDYLARNPHLKFAQGPNDTGVIISYNTEAPVIDGENPVVLPQTIAINPISWTRGETTATAGENLGSAIVTDKGEWVIARNYADARVDKKRGVVICSTANVDELPQDTGLFPKGAFHAFDYSFYYYNIRENAAKRVAKFLAKPY